MTHNELLAEIDEEIKCAEFEEVCGDGGWSRGAKALRAVVELHRPALDKEISGEDDSDTLGCAGCNFDFQYMTWSTKYPCPTIQTIERELLSE